MLYSIITINYNNGNELEQTILSVIHQTFTDYEYIIIDGGSTDNSLSIIKKYKERFAYWISETDKGIYHAMNKGIIKANGKYCIFMNSGDLFFNNNTLQQASLQIKNKDFYTGNTLLKKSDTEYFVHFSPKNISIYFFLNYTLNHQATFIKTELLKQRKYDESLHIAADWKQMFYELIYNKRSYEKLHEIITIYNTKGISSTNLNLMEKERKQTIEELFPNRMIREALINSNQIQIAINEMVENIDHNTILYKIISGNIKLLFFLYRVRRKLYRLITTYYELKRYSKE